MEIFQFLGHLDEHLLQLSQQYGAMVYVFLFIIIFSETGLVVAPFLPGDTLLFVAGAIAALDSTLAGIYNLPMLFIVLASAAFLGNAVNFQIGRYLGPRVFHWEKSRWFNPRHLADTHTFFERHGGKTILLSRFLPIIRTYAPFVAGIGNMPRMSFMLFNGAGAVLWVGSLLLAGYFFGNVPFIKGNLTAVIGVIIGITLLPVIVAGLRFRNNSR